MKIEIFKLIINLLHYRSKICKENLLKKKNYHGIKIEIKDGQNQCSRGSKQPKSCLCIQLFTVSTYIRDLKKYINNFRTFFHTTEWWREQNSFMR